jgi:serine/threonine-protein kinase
VIALLRVCLICAVVAWGARARAQPDAETRAAAQALFEEGRQLRAAGRCDDAVDKFVESQRLDPAVGTLLNLADCYRSLGRTASAWLLYTEAAGAGESRGDERRVLYAQMRASELAPRLVRLVIEVRSPAPRGLSVWRGDQRVEPAQWGTAVPVDPGTHQVSASAPGYRRWTARVDSGEPGSVVRVEVPELALDPGRRDRAPRRDEALPTSPNTTTIAGWAVAGAGVIGLGVGVGFAIRARLLVDASMRLCPDDQDVCLPEGAELRDEARTAELASIIALSTGGAAIATGVVLLIMSQSTDGSVVRPAPGGVSVAW